LFEVHPEQRSFTPPSKAGLCAAERVKKAWPLIKNRLKLADEFLKIGEKNRRLL
jgi:hypothetical protein